jgi:hypothetical protein
LSIKTKVRFLNDVCLRQMMMATPNDVRYANDMCLTAHWANIASLRSTGATSYLRSKCIILRSDTSFYKQAILWYNIGDRRCSHARKQTR